MQQKDDTTTPISVSLTIEHNGLKVAVSATGPDARKDAEGLLERAFDFVDLEEDDD